MTKGLAPLAALVFLTAACTGGASVKPSSSPHAPQVARPPKSKTEPVLLGPLPVRLPRITDRDAPFVRVGKIANYMHERWPRISVRGGANFPGTIVGYSIIAKYDGSIRDLQSYQAHVHRLTGDMYQASVELLEVSLRFLPTLQYASVWEDSLLKPFWSRDQITHLGPASAYREFHAYEELVSSAAIQPPALRMAELQRRGSATPSSPWGYSSPR